MKKILTLLLVPFLMALCAFNFQENFVVTGKVTDIGGNPIPYVNVQLGGTKVAALTDASGKYSIKLPVKEGSLFFSITGYNTVEVRIQQRTEINVTLERTSAALTEVVITSLGVQRQRRDLGYATSAIRKSEYNTSTPVNVANGLQGKVSGLQVSSNNSGYNFYYNSNDAGASANEGYANISENSFHKVSSDPLSTFSIDVDAASYSNMRRIINSGYLPPAGAIRVEEMINYFNYQYPQPKDDEPFSINTEVSNCPWNENHQLVMIGLQGKIIPNKDLPPANVVFLVDVSGSMEAENKLPLVKSSLKLLTDQLREEDKISLVVYAGNAGLVLPPTSGSNKQKIKDAIDHLEAGGSTAGGAGIQLAYKTAKENFIKNGNNRVILCTDGDFNVGASSDDAMVRLIEEERKSGVFLTVLGYGTGNYQDNKMQQLADKGNGNHAYIDGISEANKVLVKEFGGTLFTIAKDVKLQVEFNPANVAGYRLIGYENRALENRDFNDDKKDAGELGSGHTVTALYEIIPVGQNVDVAGTVDSLKYQRRQKTKKVLSGEMLTVKFRYKKPDGDISKLISAVVNYNKNNIESASDNLKFAASVAGFGMLLRDSKFKGNANYENVYKLASSALGEDREGYRKELLTLIQATMKLKNLASK